MGMLYVEAIHGVFLLEQAGYKVRTIWEHDLDQFVVTARLYFGPLHCVYVWWKIQKRGQYTSGEGSNDR